MEEQAPRERLSLPERRALGALIGAAIAMLGWYIAERSRTAGGVQLASEGPDQGFQLALIFLPMLVAWGASLLLTWKRPATRSLTLATVALLAAMATGSGVYAVVGAIATKSTSPLEFVLVFFFVLVFSFVRVGFAALIAGWLVIVFWDRWMLKRAARPH